MKYGKCWKCGAIAETTDNELGMCTAPMPVRYSNVCGGAFIEITKVEYDKLFANLPNQAE